MTDRQRLEIRISTLKSELRDLGMADDADRSEIDGKVAELEKAEARLRAMIASGDGDGDVTDVENREDPQYERLVRDCRLSRVVGAALEDRRITDGAEAELRQELEVGDDIVPWALLLEEGVEERADAATSIGATANVPVTGASIVERVFARSCAAFLGVSLPSVPVGERTYPVMTGGDTPDFVAKSSAKDAVAATFSLKELSPVRLTGRYIFAVEDAARLPGLEMALRRDLSNAAMNAVDRMIVAGDGTAPEPYGFLGGAGANQGLAAASGNLDLDGAVADFSTFAGLAAAGIDGVYADAEGMVRILLGTDSLQVAAGLFATNTAVSGTRYMADVSAGVRSSVHVAARDATAKTQEGIIRRGTRSGEAVAPMWNAGLRLVRDPYSNAASGQVALTLHILTNFHRVRDDSYGRLIVKLAA